MLDDLFVKTFIVAELSANHNNDLDIALKSIDAIGECGADAVKIQTFRPESMTLDMEGELFKAGKETIWKGKKLYDLYNEAALPYEWHYKLKDRAEKNKLLFFSSPFDEHAVDFLEELQVPLYKVASLEIFDIPLIRHIAKKMKPVILSSGVAEIQDIDLAIKTIRSEGNDQIVVLKCTSAYPAPFDEINLRSMPVLGRMFGCHFGLSDHSIGSTVPIGAVTLGAKVIEKHFILDRNMGGVDSSFSMEPQEFKEMVDNIRNIEKALGSEHYNLTQKSIKTRERGRSLFAVKDIKKGEFLSPENIKSIRPGAGLHPLHYETILGKRARHEIKRGTPLHWQLIDF